MKDLDIESFYGGAIIQGEIQVCPYRKGYIKRLDNGFKIYELYPKAQYSLMSTVVIS